MKQLKKDYCILSPELLAGFKSALIYLEIEIVSITQESVIYDHNGNEIVESYRITFKH